MENDILRADSDVIADAWLIDISDLEYTKKLGDGTSSKGVLVSVDVLIEV